MVYIMKKLKRTLLGGVSGGLVGAANGLFGGGGGMVAVPLLQKALNYPDKVAHATAILLILPICVASAFIYLFKGYAIPSVFIPVSIGSVFGGISGAKLLSGLPKKAINVIFIIVMLAAGIRMVLP